MSGLCSWSWSWHKRGKLGRACYQQELPASQIQAENVRGMSAQQGSAVQSRGRGPVQTPALTFDHVITGKSLCLSEPQFSHMKPWFKVSVIDAAWIQIPASPLNRRLLALDLTNLSCIFKTEIQIQANLPSQSSELNHIHKTPFAMSGNMFIDSGN